MNVSDDDWEMAAEIANEHLEWAISVDGQTPTEIVNGLFPSSAPAAFVTRTQARSYLETAWLSTLPEYRAVK